MNKKIKASFTVEAAIDIPIVIFIIISMMYLTFYIHDVIMLNLCAYHSGIESIFENKPFHENACEKVKLMNTLVITPTGTLTDSKDGISVTYTGRFSKPFSFLVSFEENEKVKETKKACPKMKMKRMYALKTVSDTFKK